MNRRAEFAHWALLAVATLGVGGVIVLRLAQGGANGGPPGLPRLGRKPTPIVVAFGSCPADGQGGDRALNHLKNRTDSAAWLPADLGAILSLDVPGGTDRLRRADWRPAQRSAVARVEGLPLAVEGYLVGAREEGAESPNCHDESPAGRDWHLWLSAAPAADRSTSIVVEMTPRARALHPTWNLEALAALAQDGTRVRVSGWLMFDQEHPEQVGRTRGSLWEIHPVMRLEVWRDGQWADY